MRKFNAMKGTSTGLDAWVEDIVLPTHEVSKPDANPMFLEKRVYQGSSGRVYPLRFIDGVSKVAEDKDYVALHMESEHLYVMVLPEFGGRIHLGFDKNTRYDFIYRQNVIKPALVGLAGPWISGGIEFNWPQHHRPSTYMTCSWVRSTTADGNPIFWMGEHDPMNRTKGMHGVVVRPDTSLLELKVRLYNRTPFTQTFLWWANLAARSHELYQSFFPLDVKNVADHAKRAVSTFPGCSDSYYGVPYAEIAERGGLPGEYEPQFRPPNGLAANRLDWYVNIPVPTSYMVVSTNFNFFGGYDHSVDAGFVHVADRHIAPGKKQWTWGNHEFGYAWDRNLTDEGGPYVELMAGVYTDNQPDFSFIAPYETKTFSQYWYPIRKIGPASNATKDAAISIHGNRVGVCPSGTFLNARIEIVFGDSSQEFLTDLSPKSVFLEEFDQTPIAVRVTSQENRELVAFDERTLQEAGPTVSATEPPAPSEVSSPHNLYIIGTHLEQYRHATRSPEDYWLEAIRRFPDDPHSRVAMAKRLMQRGLLQEAKSHLEQAIVVQTSRNPNPENGEALYHLGLVHEARGEYAQALNCIGKATWNYAWKTAAYIGMARLQMRSQEWEAALGSLAQARLGSAEGNTVFAMQSACLRKLGRLQEAIEVAKSVLVYDPLDYWAHYECMIGASDEATHAWRSRLMDLVHGDVEILLDLAFELRSCGLMEEAEALLTNPSFDPGLHPIALLLCGRRADEVKELVGNFPNRLEEILLLERAVLENGDDSIARLLLGNLYYDRRRPHDAIEQWEAAVKTNDSLSVAWRNLGIGYFNILSNHDEAVRAYDRAVAANSSDARLVFERDQLYKRLGRSPEERLSALSTLGTLIESRDDLTLEVAELLMQTGQPKQAETLISARQFAPWEGGEGQVTAQFTRAKLQLARQASDREDHQAAVSLLLEALKLPQNLAEGRHLLANASDLWLALGDAYRALGSEEEATRFYEKAADFRGDFQNMSVQAFSEMTYFQAVALRRLDRESEAQALLARLMKYAIELETSIAKIDYFATSLPTMLLFEDDIQLRQTNHAKFMQAQSAFGSGEFEVAQQLVDDVLDSNPNHSFAYDLRAELSALNLRTTTNAN
jgi:tetratricopeptide (TPR) repeat protein